VCEQRNAALVRMTLEGKRKRGRAAPREFGDGAESCAASCGGREWEWAAWLAAIILLLTFS
jgi:hypothetical protein